MKLYYSPISPFSLKTLTALHEKGVACERQIIDLGAAEARAAYKKKYPLGKVPLLELDDGYLVPESTIIIEYLDTHFDSGTRLIPADPDDARRVRFHDRQFDLYFLDGFGKIFFDARRPEAERDPRGVKAAKSTLDVMYAYLDGHMQKRTWVAGADFSMADCAAAPALAYLRKVYPYDAFKNVVAYAGRLAERPSFAKAWAEAVPVLAKLG
ncbi:MAG: glutathione S-transferase family protein [Polyangiaceae bacterium]|nr:glutathione S-transferase family protein [Polyangiaceae bacterium]